MAKTKISCLENYYTINKNYLEDLIIHMFDVTAPDSIDTRYFLKEIIFNGYCAVFNYNNNVVCASGALSGIGVYYKPVNFTPAVPFFTTGKMYDIDKNCTIVYNSDDYINPASHGLKYIIDVYARRLAEIDLSIDTSILNSRVCLIPVVNDDKDAERTREILNKMRAGESAVLSYKTSLANKNYEILPIKARDNIVVDLQNDARRNVMNTFLDFFGIPNNQVDKKERTNLAEMSCYDEKQRLSLDALLLPIKDGFDKCNAMFGGGFDISIKDYLKGGVNNVSETLPENN